MTTDIKENSIIETLTENSAFIKGQFVDPPPQITLAPCLSLTLGLNPFWQDFAEQYDAYNGLTANAISLVVDQSHRYRVKLEANEASKTLNKANLEAIDESVPFDAFQHAQELMVIVGADRFEDQQYIVNPMWIGMVSVRA